MWVMMLLAAAGEPVQTRACSAVGGAYLYATSPHMFSGATEAAFHRVRDQVRLTGFAASTCRLVASLTPLHPLGVSNTWLVASYSANRCRSYEQR